MLRSTQRAAALSADRRRASNVYCFAQAASVDRADVVQFVMETDLSEIDHPNDDSASAMMLAANFGHLNIVQELLWAGAALNRQSTEGNTALMLAVQNNVPEPLRFREHGVLTTEVGMRDRNDSVMP